MSIEDVATSARRESGQDFDRRLSLMKLATLAGIALAALIPIVLISSLVDERQAREGKARQDIVRSWGPEQAVWGPTLVIAKKTKDGKTVYWKLAPKTLDVRMDLAPERRKRGLFGATVYTAAIEMSGMFELPEGFHRDGTDNDDGVVTLGLSGTDGIRDDDRATIGGSKVQLQACRDVFTTAESCRDYNILVADVDFHKVAGATLTFASSIHVRGTSALSLIASAKRTTLTLAGAWESPRFIGDRLPTASIMTPNGFEANWIVDRIGKPAFTTSDFLFDRVQQGKTIGVDLIEATSVYRMILRASKYSLLLVVLSFATYFLFELVSGIQVTAIQYALLGASLSLFTLLLLSLGEVMGYTAGYVSSASMVVIQASIYTVSVTRRVRASLVFSGMLITLFGFLYVLLGMETYALVVGAFSLFLIVSVIMTVTQHLTRETPRLADAR